MRLRNIRIAKYYPRSGSYDFRYKSVAVGATDVVKVDFGGYLEKDSVVFKDRFGVPIKLNPQTNTLTFTAPQSADTNYIYAYDKTGERIGKLMVKTYAVKVYDVVLVRLKDSLKPDAIHANISFSADDLKNYLDAIYKQANVSFNVKVIDFAVENLLPFSHGDKRRFSGYNDDQKRILEAFDSKIEDNINYLFFLPAGAETSGVAGYNPFGYNFGFIYDGANMRTVAHELGHGIGSLRHPFDETVAVKGQTDNLMDYNDKQSLWHFQWDMMQKPPKRIFKWRFEEGDAENVEKELLWIVKADFENYGLFLAPENNGFLTISPAGYPIWLYDLDSVAVLASSELLGLNLSSESLCSDAVYGFATNGKLYFSIIESGKKFLGYYCGSEKYVDYGFTGSFCVSRKYLYVFSNIVFEQKNKDSYHSYYFCDEYDATGIRTINYVWASSFPEGRMPLSGWFLKPDRTPIYLDGVSDLLVLLPDYDINPNIYNQANSVPTEAVYGFIKDGNAYYTDLPKRLLQKAKDSYYYNYTQHILFDEDTEHNHYAKINVNVWNCIDDYKNSHFEEREVDFGEESAGFGKDKCIGVFELDKQKQVWLYNSEKDEFIVVFGASDAQKLLRMGEGKTITLRELQDRGLAKNYREMTLKQFSDSFDYNWVRQEVMRGSNTASEYVMVTLAGSFLLPYIVEYVLADGSVFLYQRFSEGMIKMFGREEFQRRQKKFIEGASQKFFATFVEWFIMEVADKCSDTVYDSFSCDHYIEKYISNGEWRNLVLGMFECGVANMFDYSKETNGLCFGIKASFDCISSTQKWLDDYNNGLLTQDLIGCVMNMLIGGIGSSLSFENEALGYLSGIGTAVSQDCFHTTLENLFKKQKRGKSDE